MSDHSDSHASHAGAHAHLPTPVPARRAFSLAQQGLALRLGVAAVLVALVWLVIVLLVRP